ncbi:MAG: uroporphyrinogen-III synthase [Wenzhouxiangella sp.]
MNSETLVLVTRFGPEGDRLARILSDQGLPAAHFAPVELAGPEDPAACRARLLALLPCDRLIVPSAEALRQAVVLVGVVPLAELPLIVPGAGTARAARELGFVDVSYPDRGGTSEDILDLPQLDAVDGLKVLVLAAAGGRRDIGRELARRGATVERLHVYRRLPADPPAGLESRLLACTDPVTLLASGGALAGLEAALGPAAWSHLLTGLMVAPSARVAVLARAAGADRVETATGADHAAMLQALALARRDLGVCVTLG